MDKITEALKNLLPADQLQPVVEAIQEMLDETKAELEQEFEAKLEEAYEQASQELVQAEHVAEQGYQQAYHIIHGLRGQMESQQEEFKRTLDEGYAEAFEELKKERARNENIASEIYEEYDNKLAEMREYMIDKIDKFMEFRTNEMYEHAMKELLNDPRVVEQKIVVEKMAGLLSDYLSDEDVSIAAHGKIDEAYRLVEDLKAQKKVLEAKSTRLAMQNNKLNESLREAQGILNEYASLERKERANAGKASGKGQRVVDQGGQVINEYHNPDVKPANDSSNSDLVENAEMAAWEELAGIPAIVEAAEKKAKAYKRLNG